MSVHKPKVSIIVPVYNAGEFLADCLNSIINQTLIDIEIICVNDGSNDNSPEILENFQKKDTRVRIINKENGGLSSARNEGMKNATGIYIGFVDSDDWVDKNYFECLYELAINISADICMANVKRFYALSNSIDVISDIGKIINKIEPNIVVNVCDRKKVIATSIVCNKLFSRNFLNTNNFQFYEGLFWEDNPFTVMTAISANKIGIVRDSYYYYRIHSGNMIFSATSDRKSFDLFEIMAKLKQFFDDQNIYLIEGYNYYYEELLFKYYFNHLVERIDRKFRKEFFNRVKTEFSKLNQNNINLPPFKYLRFKLIRDYNYFIFLLMFGFIKVCDRVVFSLIPIRKTINIG